MAHWLQPLIIIITIIIAKFTGTGWKLDGKRMETGIGPIHAYDRSDGSPL